MTSSYQSGSRKKKNSILFPPDGQSRWKTLNLNFSVQTKHLHPVKSVRLKQDHIWKEEIFMTDQNIISPDERDAELIFYRREDPVIAKLRLG